MISMILMILLLEYFLFGLFIHNFCYLKQKPCLNLTIKDSSLTLIKYFKLTHLSSTYTDVDSYHSV